MEWELFCEQQAIACESRAEALGGRAQNDWLALAEEWRTAATEPEPPYGRVWREPED